jgi:hypothetical protein
VTHRTKAKKAQGGMNAAVLVAIVAALIILYIVFLPESERNQIIDDTPGGTETAEGNVLLRVSPGVLSVQSGLEAEKKVPNVYLIETTNAKELERINPFIVKNSWFGNTIKTADFRLEEPQNVQNAMLTFTAKAKKGILTIKLNGQTIYENEIAAIAEPVRLSSSLLQENNQLEFSVSSSGARFWSPNQYSLDNVRIIADISDTSRQESSNLFVITDSEYGSIERATLKFVPYCGNINDVGQIEIYVNGRKLLSSVPLCDQQYKQAISKSMLNEGENNIVFKTTSGSYSVEQIAVALEYRTSRTRTYYFEVPADKFRQIRNGDLDAEVTVKFVDNSKMKRAKLDVNGRIETIDTDRSIFNKAINSKITDGNNYIRIEPIDEIEILELKIELV